jgi:peroxiredoxin
MREKKSPECLYWMAQAYQGLGAYKNLIETCEKAIEFVANDTQLRAQLYNLEGVGFQLLSEGQDQKKLQQAESALRRGLALDFALPSLRYNLGIVLLQQQRDAEGVAELKNYLEAQPSGVNADGARKIIANPRRAREPYAPEFSITTSEREYIALEDLLGKVVLLDFWGTWCPPCVASVPSLRNLYKRHAKEPWFVMIGISSDTEELKWRGFIEKNQMVWPQYLDRDRRIARAFDIRVFPTYVLIDHEGILRFRGSGSSFERAADLENALQKQLKLASKAMASSN